MTSQRSRAAAVKPDRRSNERGEYLKPSRRHESGVWWWLDLVGLAEADANEPIDHHGEWEKGEHRQKDGAAQKAGKTCCWPRKKEPVAMKSPKHMRQR
jgi:hypothetical protein